MGDTDIYLIDQILKGRYKKTNKVLDAGCGTGRNMYWFLQQKIKIYGTDLQEAVIAELKKSNPKLAAKQLQTCAVEKLPFADAFFDHIISSAVLHFAPSVADFTNMVSEMCRVLKPGGSLFVRMATNIGMEDKVKLLSNGNYYLPDDSVRFLLTRPLLNKMLKKFNLSYMENFKIVNVDGLRCMCTLVLQKG